VLNNLEAASGLEPSHGMPGMGFEEKGVRFELGSSLTAGSRAPASRRARTPREIQCTLYSLVGAMTAEEHIELIPGDEPNYLAQFTSCNQVISYQRRFLNAAKGQE
jgi:hypothetical protein